MIHPKVSLQILGFVLPWVYMIEVAAFLKILCHHSGFSIIQLHQFLKQFL